MIKYSNNETFPSHEFFLHTGIDNIYKEWVITFDVNKFIKNHRNSFNIQESLEKLDIPYFLIIIFLNIVFLQSKKAICEKTYRQIVSDNPELKNIKVVTYLDKLNLVTGVISKFNYNDIKFFVENYNIIIEYNEKHRVFYDKVQEVCGAIPEWILSPSTIKDVKSYLNIEYSEDV